MTTVFFCIFEIAGISVRFGAPRSTEMPPKRNPIQTDKTEVREVYRIEFIHSSIRLDVSP